MSTSTSTVNLQTRNDGRFNNLQAVSAQVDTLSGQINDILTISGNGATGGVNLSSGTAGITLSKDTVTQATSITTAVTSNSAAGLITTQSASTAAEAAETFTVNNDRVLATSGVEVWIQSYAGTYSTNGLPVVNANAVAAGSFNVILFNAHSTAALSGALVIGYRVL